MDTGFIHNFNAMTSGNRGEIRAKDRADKAGLLEEAQQGVAKYWNDQAKAALAESVNTLVDAKRSGQGGGVATFVDQTDDIGNQDAPMIPSIPLQGVYTGGLEEYLKRPTKIYTYQWDITGSTFSFDPYDLLLSDLPITRKMANFWKITFGGLDLKIITNGTPYLYGAYYVGWWPYFVEDSFATTFARSDPKTISTKPNFTIIDPSSDCVRYMEIPEVKQYDLVIPQSTPNWGNVVGCVGAPLKSATSAGTTQYCYMTFYVNARNPKVEFNTLQAPVHGTSQEYSGKVSAPLEKLSKFSTNLSKVPLIGQYATPVAEAAKLGARMASMFGFSKPLKNESECTTLVVASGNITNSDGSDSSVNLALTKMALTTIDPTLIGLPPDDQMAIPYITRRWSHADTFTWDDTQAVGTQLYTSYVGPMTGNPGTYPCGQTNLSFISSMFEYWRGGIELRLVFYVSKFHTGRVQIIYEPSTTAPGAIDVTNITQNWIVDLSDTTTVNLQIPYPAKTQALPTLASNTSLWGAVPSTSISIGKVYVKVLSGLRAGSVATTVTACLYIRAAEDFELYQFDLGNSRNSTTIMSYQAAGTAGAAPTNFGYAYLGTSETVGDIPVTTDSSTQSNTDNPIMSSFIASERVLSLREVGKRYAICGIRTAPVNANTKGVSYFCERDFPVQPGYSVPGSGAGTATLQYYNTPHCFLTAIGPAYVGYRGAIRTKLQPVLDANSNLIVTRCPASCANYQTGNTTLDVVSVGKYFSQTSAGSAIVKTNIPAYFGPSSTNAGLGDCIEVSNPWVSVNNFEQVQYMCTDYNLSSGILVFSFNNSTSTAATTYLRWKAIGDDFSFIYYKGPPVLYQTTIA